MIHIGEPDFYQEMNYEAVNHDVVYYEGCWIPGRKLLSFFYKAAAVRSGLRYQGAGHRSKNRPVKLKGHSVTNRLELDEYVTSFPCFCRKCPAHSVRSIRADLHEPVARHAIKNIPLMYRLLSPLIILGLLCVGIFGFSRKAVLGVDIEDINHSDVGPILAPFWKFITDDRDYFLQSVLNNELVNVRPPDHALCVKYGVAHMNPLVDFLKREWGYEIVSRRNVLAVKADKAAVINPHTLGHGIAKARFDTRFAHETYAQETGAQEAGTPQAKSTQRRVKRYRNKEWTVNDVIAAQATEDKRLQNYMETVELTAQEISSFTMHVGFKDEAKIRDLSLSYTVDKTDGVPVEINFVSSYPVKTEVETLLKCDGLVGDVAS